MMLHHKIFNIYKNVDVFISPSCFLKDKLYEMGFKGKIKVLPNFINFTDFVPQYGSDSNTICYVGRLSKEKGVATLIKSVKGLDVELKIIGDGPVRQELESFVTREGITNVKFLGYCLGDTLKDEVRSSLFMIIPSECYENNPFSVIEAFALGKPVLGVIYWSSLISFRFSSLVISSFTLQPRSLDINSTT